MGISMYERVKTINEYYTYLEYKDNKREALGKISTLSKELKFEDSHDFSHRFFETATLIKKNLRVFMAACEHIDVITTIVDYFIHFAVSFKLDNESGIYNNDEKVILIMLTIYNMHKEHAIQLFLEAAIIKNSQVQIYNNYKELIRPNIKMILLEDSDLHAVIKCLKIKNLFQLDKIWVEESIKKSFAWYLKKYFEYLQINLYTFRSKELLTIQMNTTEYIHTLHIVSIWSEDIIAAKNLAESLNHDVLFINSYMDFCPGIVLPYTNIYLKPLSESFNLQENKHVPTNSIDPTTHEGLVFDLFYDGMWQKPMKNTYWIHNNFLLANATCGDIMGCINSATKGFKIWSNMSSDLRMQLLIKFANILECNGQFSQTKTILNWIKLPYICGSLIHCFQTERFEVIKTRKPQGIIILKEKDEIIMFRELTQSLIIGNCVIVVCNPDLCIMALYCNLFKMCGIPPGVINLLSSKNTDFRYNTINNSTINETYEALTQVKHIIVSRK